MRKLLLCWAMAGSHLLYAQDPLDSLRSRLQHLFEPVTSAYPTRTFLEKGDNLVPIPDPMDPKKEMQLGYFSMLHQSVRTAQPVDKQWPLLQLQLSPLKDQARNRVPMAVMDATISLLNDDAVGSGSLSYANEQFLPHSGSFFSSKRLMELSSTRATAEGPVIELWFPGSLWFSDQQGGSVQIHVKTGAQWETVAKGGSLWLRNLSEGVQKLEYRIVSGSDTSFGTTSFKVLLPSTQSGLMEWVIPEVTGRHAGGRATVQFAPGNNTGHLRNPVILVEGIDYYQVAPDLINYGNSDWADIKSNFTKIVSWGNLNSSFDFVFLDFGQGADAIDRNAEVLRDLIGIVNQDKLLGGSTTSNVVIGHSMGGLVARYCLSKMAKEGFNSQTTKLFTHDSPHDGAHLPLGLQYLFHAINGVAGKIPFVPYVDQGHAMLSAPASIQMLRYRASSLNNYSENTWLDQVYRPMVTFPDGAQPFEFIATSLGSECGITDQTPGQSFFNFDLGLDRIFSVGNPLLSVVSQVSSWKLRVLAKAQGEVPGSEILSLTLRHDRSFFNGFVRIGFRVAHLSAKSPNGIPNLDFAPGGLFFMSDLGYQFLGGLATSNNALHLNSGLKGVFTFIPVKSGLDMPGTGNSSYFKAYNPWMNGLSDARVGKFRAAEPQGHVKNFHHGYLSNLQAKLILSKIFELPYNDFCPLECNPDANISGPLAICPGETGLFYVQSTAGDNVQFQWSGHGGIDVGGQNPDGSASFSVPSGNTNNSLQIRCNLFKNGCNVDAALLVDGTSNLAPIAVRCGDAPNVTNPGDVLCQNSPLYSYFYVESIPIGSNYQVTWTPLPDDHGTLPIIEPYMSNGVYRNARVKTNGVSKLRFRVQIQSDCGEKSKDFEIPYTVTVGGSACIVCDQGAFARVEPPVVNEGSSAEVLVIKPTEGLGSIEILDDDGHLMISKTSEVTNEKMDISQLEAGNYIVRIQNPETGIWEEKPLEIKPGRTISISPNPGSNQVQMFFDGSETSSFWKVTVLDRFGTVRYFQTLPFQPEAINVSALQSDLYLFKVETSNHVYQTWFRKD